jgi:hypothetical protein
LLGNDREISDYKTAVARQWLGRDHVVTRSDTNVTIVLQQRNNIFYAGRVKML